ncbi:MAG: hypothetical protein JNL75_08305 [Chitinophagales bacterium]|nr:hypothetical protein [Chitinophagales bacterium]
MEKSLWFTVLVLFNNFLYSQATLTGNFRLNVDMYVRDSAIAAVGPNYEVNKNSANAWFQMIYSDINKGFEGGIRFDGNYNSILQTPPIPLSFYGIGNWYLKKKIENLELTGGFIYEQYGSGVALRTFEERNLGIDNAIFGIRAKYYFNDKFMLRGIAGTQKYRMDYFGSFVKGLNFEGNIELGKNRKTNLNFGAAVVSRTLIEKDREIINNTISTYQLRDTNRTRAADYFQAPYNTYVFNYYHTLQIGKITWGTDLAYKTKDAVFNQFINTYQYRDGYSIMNSLSYSQKGLGLTFQNRIVNNFQFQSTAQGAVADFNLNNNRRLSFLAPINRQNSLRLPARFQIAPIEISEVASSLDITYSPSKKTHINLNISVIDSALVFKTPYYKEFYLDIERKKFLNGKMDLHGGFQYVFYNQQKYLAGNEPTDIQSYTFFLEPTYRINRKHSLRFEFQYQHAAKELGQSLFALIEYNAAPNWSISVSDLYNFSPNKNYEVVKEYQQPHHFYSIFTSYTKGATRFTLSYSRQLAGIICTGGVCRFEPAFSGLRMQITSSF